jgi:hypothetical protein
MLMEVSIINFKLYSLEEAMKARPMLAFLLVASTKHCESREHELIVLRYMLPLLIIMV